MLEILAITTPIFLLIGMGYLAMASRLINREQVQGIATFVLYFALPALVIRALTQNPLDEVFQPQYLLAYGLGSLVVFGCALLLGMRFQRKSLSEGAIQALGVSASNSGFVGYPVAAMVIGSPAAVFLALNMLIENLLIIPAALILAEMGRQSGAGFATTLRKTMLRLARNPILIGLVVGLLLAVTDTSLPSPLARSIDMLANASGPAALFVIGGTLYGLQVRGMALDVSQVVVGKLVLHPLAVLGIFLLIPDHDPMLLTGALLFACAPMISVYPLLGHRYGMAGVNAAALMVGTLGAFFTLSLAIWLMTLNGLLPTG
ncbi:AEC family transporter [Halomonas urumqiensis]|uniref:Permease n=1 Tax=Halomonas urumqiensis TaxID=1684789 RepID=A0A2N7UJ85_9GAMM|nr:AEC family transporter [Halomonas urumqiensis]PMR80465.1 permease [Halomonas urumqiensis]PTB01690.1 AEC family transporter [Halomonas urumqiensis]GHE22217.1 malonate transporter [Halomonas urumqiensis]